MNIADPTWVTRQVRNTENHRKLFIRGVSSGHLHHHALAVLHEQRGDEHEEDVVEEQGTQQDCADFQAGQSEHLQHVNTEHDPEDVLQDPGPLRLPEHEPCHRGRDGGWQQQELPQLQLEDAEIEVTSW